MDNTFQLYVTRPAPTNTKTFRQATDWTRMDNETLKFSLDLLFLHQSDYLADALQEVERRIERGAWLDIDQPVPTTADVPGWLYIWPFCLLWSQRPR